MVDFSLRLKQLRLEKHLTQAQVAERIGVTPSMVSSYETDIRLPSFEVMPRISVLFGVTVDCLLCRGQALSGHLCPQRPGGPGGLRYDGNPETTISLFERKVVVSCGNQKSAMTT